MSDDRSHDPTVEADAGSYPDAGVAAAREAEFEAAAASPADSVTG